MSLDEWMRDGKYLPEPLRDFHDQKRIFKIVGEMASRCKQRDSSIDLFTENLPNWISAQIYVIDFFLWFMARRGYTLQRSRQQLKFLNLDDDIAAFEKREMEAFKAIMESEHAK